MKRAITLQVIDERTQRFTVFFDRPGRIEVSVSPGGRVLAEVYEGTVADEAQEPLGAYDGTVGRNRTWRH